MMDLSLNLENSSFAFAFQSNRGPTRILDALRFEWPFSLREKRHKRRPSAGIQFEAAVILDDVLAAVREGRSPLVLTERKSHADWFAEALSDKVANLVVLKGGQGIKKRRASADQIVAMGDSPNRIIVR